MSKISLYDEIDLDNAGYPISPEFANVACEASWRACLARIRLSKDANEAARHYQFADGYLGALKDAGVVGRSASVQLYAQLLHEWAAAADRV